MSRLLLLLAGFGLSSIAACVTYSDAEITSDAGKTVQPSGDDDGGDAGTGPSGPSSSDAAVSDATIDVGTPTTPNLLANAGFEDGCDDIFADKATVIEFAETVPVGATYVGELWVKAPKSGTDLQTAQIEEGMDSDDQSGNGDENGPINAVSTLSSSAWTDATTLFTVTKPNGVSVWVALLFDSNERSHCVLVDDASLRRNN